MRLKPKLETTVALVIGGCILSAAGLGMWRAIGGYAGLIPGVFGLLGVSWLCMGTLALVRRKKLAIIIDDSGIDFPAFSLLQKDPRRLFLAREEIEAVSKNESIKGRLIEVATKSRGKVLVQARFYCELDEFLSHCKAHGLPVA
jgi:hypothetical protein